MDWIKPLHEITLADIDAVGSKAAHLGAMLRAGFPVPSGFVIQVDAFIAHMGQQTDSLVKPPVPRLQPELMAQVVQALIDHLGDQEHLAVRSSATDEDSPHASFAGQHSTYYFVTPNKIDEAIVDCWMSLWSEAALAYRRAGWQDIVPGQPIRMAVIVQKMLVADSAGVVFSRDPVNPDSHDSLIEACWGLGAALVDGRVTPDQYRVSEEGEILQQHIANKKYQVQVSRANREGHRLQEVAKQTQGMPVLDAQQINKLANFSLQLETLFEFPQDIEWAYEKDQLYLLQSRPITTFPGYHDIDERLVLFKPMAENFTEPLTPLSEDLYAQTFPNIGAFYQGRFYLRFDLLEKLNPFELTQAELSQAFLLRPVNRPVKLNKMRVFGLALLGAFAFLLDGVNWIRSAWLSRQSQDALDHYADIATKVANNPRYDARRALRRLIWGQHPFEPITAQMMYCNISAGRYFIFIGILNQLVSRWAPDYPRLSVSKLIHRQDDMASLQLIDAMSNLTKLLRTTLERSPPDTQNSAQPTATDQLRSVLAGDAHVLPAELEFTEAFESFLQEFGHRGPRELELAAPRWRETPADLLSLIYHGTHCAAPSSNAYASHLTARDELHQQLRPWQRKIVDALVAKITQLIVLRENTRQHHIRAFSVTRQKLLAQEQQLIHALRLRIPGDIFFLDYQHVTDLAQGDLNPDDAQLIIRKRRRQWQRYARLLPQASVNLAVSDHQPKIDPNEGLSGQCASPGTVSGKARVILSLSQSHELQSDEILVAPYTDPAWTPLFTRAAGVIVGVGSYLSHAGTLARELQVPCLVDVTDCTRIIPNGSAITLDASGGMVLFNKASKELSSLHDGSPDDHPDLNEPTDTI